MLKISRHPISLDRPVGESEDSYFGDFIEDDSVESPVNAATQEMLKDKIEHVLKTLTYREREELQQLPSRIEALEEEQRALNEVQAEADLEDGEVRRLRDDQLTFLRYHAAGNDGHLRMLAAALRSGMLGEEDVTRIVATAKVTARLYALQLEELGNA